MVIFENSMSLGWAENVIFGRVETKRICDWLEYLTKIISSHDFRLILGIFPTAETIQLVEKLISFFETNAMLWN